MGSTPHQLSAHSSTPSSSVTDPSQSPLAALWQLVQSERRDIVLVVSYGAAVGVLSLVVPIAAQSLVNTVAFNSLLQPILVLTTIVLLMLGTASFLRLIQTALVETIQQRIFARIALDLAYRISRLRIEAYDRNRGTELLNRFFEVLTVQKSSALMLLDGIAVALQAAIGLVLLAFYHPILLAFDAILIVSMGLVLWTPAGRAIKTSLSESKAKYKVAAWLEEIARNPIAFKLSNGGDHALARANEVTQEYLLARKAHFKVLRLQIGGTLLVQTLVSGLLLGLGSILVIQKQLTLGQLVAAELVVTTVVSGFSKFGKYLESFYDLTASVDKLGHLFELPLEREGGEPVAPKNLAAAFSFTLKNVSFRYADQTDLAIDDVQLQANPGSRIGIKGINGSGKSTLLDLLVGLRSPTKGAIEVGGTNLKEVNLEDLRKHIALVRKAEIFDGTILENLRVGRRALPLESIRQALSQVQLLDEIDALPEGLLTELTGTQNPLSTGQLQRLMIARAIVGQPRLLLLDEAFENIDAKTKAQVLRVVFAPDAPWTAVLTTHDAFELSFCETLFQLQDGRLYGPGNPPPQDTDQDEGVHP